LSPGLQSTPGANARCHRLTAAARTRPTLYGIPMFCDIIPAGGYRNSIGGGMTSHKAITYGLLILLIATISSSTTQAQVFSLWGDEGMTTCEVHTAAPYQPFNVFVFLEPGIDGAFYVQYKLKILPGHFSIGQVINPVVSDAATIGVWFGSPGISAPFTSCQVDLLWIVNLTMMAPNTTPGYYEIKANEDSQLIRVCPCVGPCGRYDNDEGFVYNQFGFNETCIVSTEETSWGAIKSLYR
jgi:hypothetical protein